MSRQHYLPASYIGRFSLDGRGNLRKRAVWVQRIGERSYKASAEYVARAHGFYDRHSEAGGIDEAWAYENDLPRALDELIDSSRPLDGRTWAHVLVPFFSSLFIRGVDFEQRYTSRIPGVTGPGGSDSSEIPGLSWHDNALTSALIEWQRLLPPTLAAQWIVLHGSGAPILPTNDVGHCLTTPPGEPHRIAYAFPLDPAHMLVLERRVARRILDWDGRHWISPIEHRLMSDADLMNAREALAHGAVSELYGPTPDAVHVADEQFEPEVGPVGPHFLLPTPRMRAMIPYLEDYFRILTLLEAGLGETRGEIDWEVVAKSWRAPIQVATNLPMFPGGLAHCGSSLYIDLTRFTIEDVLSSVDQTPSGPLSTEPSRCLQRLLHEEDRIFSDSSEQVHGTTSRLRRMLRRFSGRRAMMPA